MAEQQPTSKAASVAAHPTTPYQLRVLHRERELLGMGAPLAGRGDAIRIPTPPLPLPKAVPAVPPPAVAAVLLSLR